MLWIVEFAFGSGGFSLVWVCWLLLVTCMFLLFAWWVYCSDWLMGVDLPGLSCVYLCLRVFFAYLRGNCGLWVFCFWTML